MRTRRISFLARTTVQYLVLLILGTAFMVPVIWMLSSSLHDVQGVFALPFKWIPGIWHWENYYRVVTLLPFGRYFVNTLIITVPYMLFMVLSSSFAAYGFSRLRFPGRDKLFALCVATMMLPGQVTIIPLYIMYSKLGLVDTYWPLIIPAVFGSPFYIFLLRQFFLTIPRELDEAALIDGASHLRIYWSVILPQARPALATVLIFSFIGSWNDFFGPLIYINSPEKATLTLGLNLMKTQILGSGVVEWNTLMAASVLVLIPNVVLFFLAQKQFMRGINLGGIRG